MDKFREPEQFDAEVEIHDGEPFAVWAPAVNGSHVKAELYFALLAELEASKKSNAFLKEQLAKLANFNPDWDMLEACRESWREVAAAIKEAEARLEAKDNRITELESIRSDASQVFKEIGNELGCNPDNESIMMAIDALKEREKRVVALAGGSAELWKTMAARLEAAEAKLATPVRLPTKYSMLHREDFHSDYQSKMVFKADEVIAALHAHGLTVEGDE
ncbi:hypothetical protein AB4J75_09580 [Serratia marcescens]|uniref:hypothetical protein n=1 Tax=Serratia marcescens TaxID=615 RepID=UPI003D027669